MTSCSLPGNLSTRTRASPRCSRMSYIVLHKQEIFRGPSKALYGENSSLTPEGTQLGLLSRLSNDTERRRGSLVEPEETVGKDYQVGVASLMKGPRITTKLLNRLYQQELAKYPTFEEAYEAFRHGLRGLYWHVTDNPSFYIDPKLGPQDMAGMSAGDSMESGKFMVAPDIKDWSSFYENRDYAALVDLSNTPREDYRDVSRGFGSEIIIHDPSRAEVVIVVSKQKAYPIQRRFDQNVVSQSYKELKSAWVTAVDYRMRTATISLADRIRPLAPKIVELAQKVLDDWEQDEQGYSEWMGYGGVCHIIEEEAISSVLAEIGIDTTSVSSDHEVHVYTIAYDTDTKEAVMVDIRPWCYETGAGYTWRKIPDAVLEPPDVVIEELDYDDVVGPNEEYLDY